MESAEHNDAHKYLGIIIPISTLLNIPLSLSLTLARACTAKGYCSRSVGRSVCHSVCYSHIFSRTVAAVDTKHGSVGMCNGRSAQQESGAALSKHVYGGGLKLYTVIILGVH